MRVTQTEMSRSFLSDIGNLSQELSRYSSQVSSGKLLQHLKDSPVGSAELVRLAKLDADIDQYLSNTDAGSLYLGVADSALNEVNNLFTSIYAKGGQVASEIIGDDVRAAFASELRSLRDQIISLANSEVRGRHIFAGGRVTSSPFLLVGDSVAYQGDSTMNTLSIGNGVEVQMHYAGDTVFAPVFAAIDSLLAAVEANDRTAIQNALSEFSPAVSNLSQVRARIGSSMNMLENIQARLESREMDLKAQRSRIEDADMAEAAVRLKQTQTALDAAMSAGGAVLTQSNLFDFLG